MTFQMTWSNKMTLSAQHLPNPRYEEFSGLCGVLKMLLRTHAPICFKT